MTEHVHSIMDRNIFNLNLTVEATSAYIVITSILQENARPSMDAIRSRWTTDGEKLEKALVELLNHNVIKQHSGPKEEVLFYANPSSLWR